MIHAFKPSFILLLAFSLITGVLYPLLVTVAAQLLMPAQANGSLVMKDNHAVGSALIGQPFSRPEYFWGRPSATSPNPYNAGASSGSNEGPSNPALLDAIKTRISTLQAADPDNKALMPIDLITASASGLDPHISPAAAEYQVLRVAKAHNIEPELLRSIIKSHSEGRQWGLLGEPRVNVLDLNLTLANNQTVAVAEAQHDYKLPPSKVNSERCKKQALQQYPGEIEKERLLDKQGHYWVEYDIQAHNGAEWHLSCDLQSGEITQAQQLDVNAP